MVPWNIAERGGALLDSSDLVGEQRSFNIVHHDGDAWFHFISTFPPTRMKDKKLEISTYTQHDVSSLAGC